MIGIRYFKAEPTEYARLSVGEKVKKEGKGARGWYLAHNTSIELVCTTIVDQPFQFNESTADNQEVSLQGGFMYKVDNPAKILAEYNHSIDPKTKNYLTEDPRKLPEHILEIARASARKVMQKKKLEELLVMADEISHSVSEEVSASPLLEELGVKVSTFYIAGVKASSEITKALGATYRESLLRSADKAAYERRAAAVEQERAIKDNELTTKTYLAKKEEELVALEGSNLKNRARAAAEAAKMQLSVYQGLSAEELKAHALLEFGKNAKNIQNFSVTPEMLGALREATKTN